MRQFASPGFRVWNLAPSAKVLYTSFCVMILLGIASSAVYYGDLTGGGLQGVRSYYAGHETPAAPPEPTATTPGPTMDLPREENRLVVAVTYRKVLEVTHFHLFTMPVVLLIVGHLFFATGLSERAKLSWILVASATVLVHIATPWVVRYGGGGLAPLHALSGLGMTISMTALTGYPVYAMWFGRPADDGPPRPRGNTA